jgi:hypothetical protein
MLHSVHVRYEEVTSSPKIAVKLAQNKIKKAHTYVLTLVSTQVSKNAHLTDTPPADIMSAVPAAMSPNDTASQRSNTDAIAEATTTDGDVSDDGELFEEEKEEELLDLVSWESLPLDVVRTRLMKPGEGVLVSNRVWRLRTYKNVFVGDEAVDWLVAQYPINRDAAVNLMRELQRQGWLMHVKNDHLFKDDHLFFVWRDASTPPPPINEPRHKVKEDMIEMMPFSNKKKGSNASGDAVTTNTGNNNNNNSSPAGLVVSAQLGSIPSKTATPALEKVVVIANDPRESSEPSKIKLILNQFNELSLDGKALVGCGFGAFLAFILGWTTLFTLICVVGSFFCFRVGKASVDDELRLMKRKLAEMERRIAEGGVAGTAALPIVTAIEPDRDVAKLLVKHKSEIEQMASKLGPEIDPKVHDEIFLLRFILSFKEVDLAVDAVRKCIAWRTENAALLQLVDRKECVVAHERIAKYAVSAYHSKPLADGSPLLVTRAGICDLTSLLENVTQAELVDWLMWLNETAHRECDRITRETGRITKVVRVNDMAGASL